MKYIYPAVFTPAEEGGYSVIFPDIPGCYTDGDTIQHSLTNAEDVVSLMLWAKEESTEAIAPASDPASISIPAGGFLSLVSVGTLEYRKNAIKGLSKRH